MFDREAGTKGYFSFLFISNIYIIEGKYFTNLLYTLINVYSCCFNLHQLLYFDYKKRLIVVDSLICFVQINFNIKFIPPFCNESYLPLQIVIKSAKHSRKGAERRSYFVALFEINSLD